MSGLVKCRESLGWNAFQGAQQARWAAAQRALLGLLDTVLKRHGGSEHQRKKAHEPQPTDLP